LKVRIIALMALGVFTSLGVSGCGSKAEEGSIPTGEIKTAPAGKTNTHGPVGSGAPEKATPPSGGAASTE